jgi:hypothetical protein
MNVFQWLTGAAVLIAAAGCGSNDSHPLKPPPAQPAGYNTPGDSAPAATMIAYRANLTQAQKQIDATILSLTKLTSPEQVNLPSAYNQYCDELAAMQQLSDKMKREANAMRASQQAYFDSWDQKLSQVDNANVRSSVEARRQRLRDAQDQLIATSSAARDAYTPFMRDLQDIKKYLAADLSKSTVADMNNAAINVQTDGANVKAKIDSIIKVLDGIEAAEPA